MLSINNRLTDFWEISSALCPIPPVTTLRILGPCPLALLAFLPQALPCPSTWLHACSSGHLWPCVRLSQLTLNPNSFCFPSLAAWWAATRSAFLTKLHRMSDLPELLPRVVASSLDLLMGCYHPQLLSRAISLTVPNTCSARAHPCSPLPSSPTPTRVLDLPSRTLLTAISSFFSFSEVLLPNLVVLPITGPQYGPSEPSTHHPRHSHATRPFSSQS